MKIHCFLSSVQVSTIRKHQKSFNINFSVYGNCSIFAAKTRNMMKQLLCSGNVRKVPRSLICVSLVYYYTVLVNWQTVTEVNPDVLCILFPTFERLFFLFFKNLDILECVLLVLEYFCCDFWFLCILYIFYISHIKFYFLVSHDFDQT